MTETSPFAAYVSCLKGSAIEVFTGDANAGTLDHVQTVELLGKGLPLARSPNGKRLYASSFEETDAGEVDRIETFEICPETKRLNRISVTPVMARMAHISVDRSGQFLLCASFPSSRIAVYPIGDRGHVQPCPTASMATPLQSHQMMTDYSNRYAYVPCMKSHTVMCLGFDDRTGTLTELGPPSYFPAPGAGPRHVAHHPNRRDVYLINEMNGTVTALRMDPQTGGLTEIMTTSYVRDDLDADPWGAQIHVSPDGMRLFAADRGGNTIAIFDIDPLGGHMLNRRLIAVGANPRCHDITPNGRYLIVAALGDKKIEMYDISDPVADPVKTLDLPTCDSPAWVEIVG